MASILTPSTMMTNTTELRKRFDKTVLAQDGLIHKAEEAWEDYCRNSNGFVPKFWCSRFFPSDDILKFLQSEIEAAERRRTEECVDILSQLTMCETMTAHEILLDAIKRIESKFLKNPER